MKAQHSFKNSYDDFCGGDSMGARTPKAAGSSAPYMSADPFCQLSTTEVEETSIALDASAAGPWHSSIISSEGASHEASNDGLQRRYSGRSDRSSTCTHSSEKNVAEQLADLITDMIPDPEGAELGDSFLYAGDVPPVTKQSLSELDIQNIITNIKLRHDVNFDRDLSFRPNLDGPKGQEKMRQTSKYWRALVAELELYARLFRGAPSPWSSDNLDRSAIVQHAERRIPKMFETIHEVLKSLVPDRDHARVDEHLDVVMVMQEIERGVCDLVKLSNWTAALLKEHCAPMRDILVDEMVNAISVGVANNNSDLIVCGLRKLLGVLEAMKLDVANHQIRNLKSLLIEDTVNFERHYHLDRLVSGRSKVNIDAAHKWWVMAVEQYRPRCTASPRDFPRFQFEVFQRAVTSTFFTGHGCSNLPDTFYLDLDRLRVLKSEVDELIHFEICFDMFAQLVKEFGFEQPMSSGTRHQLRSSLSAIIGEGAKHGPQTWMFNSEPLSLEIYRQALAITGRPAVYSYDDLQKANQRLRHLFQESFAAYASELEAIALSQVQSLMTKHNSSSPIDLFNNLVTPTPPTAAQSFIPITPQHPTDTFSTNHAHAHSQEKLTDLSCRITHIILLHWRIWGPIAYIQEDDMPAQAPTQSGSEQAHAPSTSASPQPQVARSPSQNADQEAQILDAMKTGEPPDPGEASITRGTSM